MTILRFQPIAGRLEEIIEAILQTQEVASCSEELFAVHLVSEELVVNVIDYAYPENTNGYLHIFIEKKDGWLSLQFLDGGKAFDPLAKEMPDVTLPLEDRPIGGLGIFLTKKMMDDVSYQRINNENILTIRKRVSNEK